MWLRGRPHRSLLLVAVNQQDVPQLNRLIGAGEGKKQQIRRSGMGNDVAVKHDDVSFKKKANSGFYFLKICFSNLIIKY